MQTQQTQATVQENVALPEWLDQAEHGDVISKLHTQPDPAKLVASAERLYANALAPQEVVQRNRVKWLNAVFTLRSGERSRWLLDHNVAHA